jgi:hypothetical protein
MYLHNSLSYTLRANSNAYWLLLCDPSLHLLPMIMPSSHVTIGTTVSLKARLHSSLVNDQASDRLMETTTGYMLSLIKLLH